MSGISSYKVYHKDTQNISQMQDIAENTHSRVKSV